MEEPRLSLTNNPATDIIIMSNLPDADLLSFCSTNKTAQNLCNNESFWMNRTLNKYSYLVPDDIISGRAKYIHDKYIPKGTSWKEYYIFLHSIQKNPVDYYFILLENYREDIYQVLNNLFSEPSHKKQFRREMFLVKENVRQFLQKFTWFPDTLIYKEGITDYININYVFDYIFHYLKTPTNVRDLFYSSNKLINLMVNTYLEENEDYRDILKQETDQLDEHLSLYYK